MTDDQKAALVPLLLGAVLGGALVYYLMKDRPGSPYEICLHYWAQKYYDEGELISVAERKADDHCEWEKKAF
ncbi:MAG: hypothetical protein RID23_19590 [Roseovarius sp.]